MCSTGCNYIQLIRSSQSSHQSGKNEESGIGRWKWRIKLIEVWPWVLSLSEYWDLYRESEWRKQRWKRVKGIEKQRKHKTVTGSEWKKHGRMMNSNRRVTSECCGGKLDQAKGLDCGGRGLRGDVDAGIRNQWQSVRVQGFSGEEWIWGAGGECCIYISIKMYSRYQQSSHTSKHSR